MSRTDLDAHTLARSLRRMAGDGSVEWVMEPIQASVLLDIADMLDENAELRETLKRRNRQFETMTDMWATRGVENAKLREACAELLKMAESSDPEWLHWPEMHDELRELGVEVE